MTSIQPLLQQTQKAATSLRQAGEARVQAALVYLSELLLNCSAELLSANAADVSKQDAADPRTDRLLLNEQRIKSIASAIKTISALPNPSGKVLEERVLPNGLQLQKWAVPLGVVGAIYESRPNVTFDIAALCIRSGNACVLKGSREAEATNKAAVSIIKEALTKHDIDADCVTLLPAEREVVVELYKATKYVDVLIPRGSDSLIQAVRKSSLIPVIETGAGVCHVYVHQSADINKAVAIVVNAKTSRPSVCNAMDTVLVDEAVAPQFFEQLQQPFKEKNVVVYGDEKTTALLGSYPFAETASEEDFDREFLSLKCAAKVVKNIEEALIHIAQHSTKHSEAIVAEDKEACKRFVEEVDAAAVYTNASTRFTDGEEFGLGAEIGISTQKLHARGPFALEKLVTEKWVIQGDGQIR